MGTVYAFGARVREVGLPIEVPDASTRIRVHPIARDRTRNFICLSNEYYVHGLAPISMDFNDHETMFNSYSKRVCRPLSAPKLGKLQQLKVFVKKWLKDNLTIPNRYLNLEEWLASTNYNENRKDQLRTAASLNLPNGEPSLNSRHRVESHAKHESYPTYKNARSINARPDSFKAWFGPLCKTMEKIVYATPYFVKHLTPDERKLRIRELELLNYKHVMATDFTAFESHFTPEIMDVLEFQLYDYLLLPTDAKLLRDVIGGKNRMKMRTGFSATCVGRRMSGEMSTSLGNGFSNLMLALFLAHEKKCNFDGLVEGDDGLFVCDQLFTKQDYADLGFTIKIETPPNVHEAQFCGLLLSDDYHTLKDPKRVLQKFAWCDKYQDSKRSVHLGLLRAKAISLAYEAGQCPILAAIAETILLDTDGIKPLFIEDAYHQKVPLTQVLTPTMNDRVCFERHFGITVEVQLLVEDLVRQHKAYLIGPLLNLGVSQMAMDNVHYESHYVVEV